MRVVEAKAFHISIPYTFGGDVRLNRPTQEAVYIRLTDDAGTVGWGEAFGFAACAIARFAFDTAIAPMVVGQAIGDVDAFVTDIWRRTQGMSRSGPVTHAISGMEIALWDLAGKRQEKPLHALLGGARRHSIPAYASLLRMGEPALIRAECEKARSLGFGQIKLHERTLEAGRAARAVIGPDVPLMMDTNCTWDRAGALAMIPVLRPLNLAWLEEPVFAPDDYAALASLRGHGIPIAAGENVGNVVHVANALGLKAVDIMQPDVAKMGGVSAILEAARLCHAAGVEFHPHSPLYGPGLVATLHVLATMAEDISCEFFFTDLAASPIGAWHRPKDGAFAVPDGHGLGIEIDEDMLDRYAFSRGAM